ILQASHPPCATHALPTRRSSDLPGTATTKEAVLAKDPRFKEFRPFITGEIYNNNKRKRRSGGNDYWESGAVHPERMLADLIKIFHPQVLPDYQLYYYQKVQ